MSTVFERQMPPQYFAQPTSLQHAIDDGQGPDGSGVKHQIRASGFGSQGRGIGSTMRAFVAAFHAAMIGAVARPEEKTYENRH